VRAAVRGVINPNNNLPRQQMLNPEIPLVDFRITSSPRVQVTRVAEAPLRQLAVLSSLRRSQSAWKWAGTRGLDWRRSETRGLMAETVLGKEHVRRLCEGRAGVLKICGYVHSVEHSCAAAKYSTGGQLISKP